MTDEPDMFAGQREAAPIEKKPEVKEEKKALEAAEYPCCYFEKTAFGSEFFLLTSETDPVNRITVKDDGTIFTGIHLAKPIHVINNYKKGELKQWNKAVDRTVKYLESLKRE